MRRGLAIAALFTALATVPLPAQMHSGARGGASMGGASMGRGGFSSGGSIGFRGGSNFGAAPRFGAGFGTGLRQPSFHSGRSFGGFHRPVSGSRRFHHRAFFGTTFPGYYGYYGYPAYYNGGYDAGSDYYPGYDYYGSSYSSPAYSGSAYSAQDDLARQQQDIDRLEDEVARLREQREAQPREAPEAVPQADNQAEPSTPTVLIFRDKHTQEVENYAIVGGTLWIFNERRATKLPLSWLDLEATAKANDERGLTFRLPN